MKNNDSEVDLFVREYVMSPAKERQDLSEELLKIIVKLLSNETRFSTLTEREMDEFVDAIPDYSVFGRACECLSSMSVFVDQCVAKTEIEQLRRHGLIINEDKLNTKVDNLILNEIYEDEDINNLQKLKIKLETQINRDSKIYIRELYVGLATVKLNLGKMYYALNKKIEAEQYINAYLYHAADLYIKDKILLNWQYSIDLLISLRNDNIELYIKEHTSLLENTSDQNKQLVSNKILAGIYKQQESPLQYEFFSNAYKLQQAPIDPEAILIGQKEAGFSNNIKIGTSDIRECMILIIHEPIDHNTVLLHIDCSTSIDFALSEAMHRFDQHKHLNVNVIGARYISRDFDGYEDSEFNLVRTLITLFKYQNICIQSIDVGDAIPFALVFDPIYGKIKEAYPNKVIYEHNPDFAWQDLEHNIHHVFDCIADDIKYYPLSLDNESIKTAINTFLFREESFFKKESEYSCYQKHKFYEFCNYFRFNNFELFIKSISPPEELDSKFLEITFSQMSNPDTSLYQIQLEIQEYLGTIKEEVNMNGDLLTLGYI